MNESIFKKRIVNLIEECSVYNFPENDIKNLIPDFNKPVSIESSLQKIQEIQNETFIKFEKAYDIDGLEHTYNFLKDEYSKEMFLKVLVIRVMGLSKLRLPLYYSHMWKYLDKIDELKINNNSIKIYRWDFYLYNLEKIGFNIKLYNVTVGIFISFLLEQYRYKNMVFAKEGDYVIDGGACYGDSALYFADIVKDKGKVFSFEFLKENINFFHKNIALNLEKQNIIELIENPLWSDSESELSAIESGSASRLSNKENDKNAQTYKTISIDNFVIQNNIEKIDFIKLDIEGAELEALKGAITTIKKYKPKLAICLYHKNIDFSEIPKFLKEIVPEYELYLDHFTIVNWETVLFARISN